MIGEGSGMRLRSLIMKEGVGRLEKHLIMKEGVGRLEKYILEKICFSLERKKTLYFFAN